jgi:hypothetical protein
MAIDSGPRLMLPVLNSESRLMLTEIGSRVWVHILASNSGSRFMLQIQGPLFRSTV